MALMHCQDLHGSKSGSVRLAALTQGGTQSPSYEPLAIGSGNSGLHTAYRVAART